MRTLFVLLGGLGLRVKRIPLEKNTQSMFVEGGNPLEDIQKFPKHWGKLSMKVANIVDKPTQI